MCKFFTLRYSEWNLKRKLFVYMLFLAVLLLAMLAVGMTLFGRTSSISETFYDSLDMQMKVFEKDVNTQFDHLAASAITLSEEMTDILERYTAQKGIPFAALTDSAEDIYCLQELIIESLHQKLLRSNCSGAFVMLNATVNSTLPESAFSKTGIYLQTSGYSITEPDVLLYRGIADTAKSRGIALHRKWQLEFRTDQFPDYGECASDLSQPLWDAYRVTDMFTLPGTSESALLLTVPIKGTDGTFYGLCGYEVSASYFTTYHTQPSKLPHLSCLLTKSDGNVLLASETFICGSNDGYFSSAAGNYVVTEAKGELSGFTDGNFSYLGITGSTALSPDGRVHTLAVMIPKADYDHALYRSIGQTVLLIGLLAFFAISFSRYFSRRFLSPILKALEEIKSDRKAEFASGIPEIVDLIDYLAKQEREHDETLNALELRNRNAESEKARLEAEYQTALSEFRSISENYNKAQNELYRVHSEMERLAYSRKTEIDPDSYKLFIDGLRTLTQSERNIFEHYLAGRSAKEILSLTGIKESTLKYHNHNILGKLGVSSRKQMLRYAEVMRHINEEEKEADEAGLESRR